MSFINITSLTEQEINEVLARCMKENSNIQDPVDIDKKSYKDAVIALDNWLTTYAREAEQALPEPSSSKLSVMQKARLFKAVAEKKFSKEISQEPIPVISEPPPYTPFFVPPIVPLTKP